jgi:cyclophilin family peptidyl-prolyl cis-trans isomerase
MKSWIALALLACCSVAHAQTANPRVLIDTDRGPMLVELDQARAPVTVANFLAYVDGDRYDNTLFHRVVRDFIVQGGGFRDDILPIAKFANIASEANNGLLNTPGTIAMALSNGSNGQPNTASANSDFFFNTGTNTTLNGNFTVFGRLVFGNQTLATMNSTARFAGSDTPVRAPLLKRAVRVASGAFPALDLHTGAWYDPSKSGRGFSLEITSQASPATGPQLIVHWYDYLDGKQIWMNGAKTFAWGDHEVVVPMQITSGGQFGSGGQVVADEAWGTLTVRFTACDRATVTYATKNGNGTMSLQRATPVGTRDTCTGQ